LDVRISRTGLGWDACLIALPRPGNGAATTGDSETTGVPISPTGVDEAFVPTGACFGGSPVHATSKLPHVSTMAAYNPSRLDLMCPIRLSF